MWKLYSKTKNSLAIKCKYSNLVSGLPDSVYIGLVNYYDYEKDVIPFNNLFYYVMSKRKEYEYEREVRSVYAVTELSQEKSKKFKINLMALIDEIYVSPSCSSYFAAVVEDIIKKYGYNFSVRKSELLKAPKLKLQDFVKKTV